MLCLPLLPWPPTWETPTGSPLNPFAACIGGPLLPPFPARRLPNPIAVRHWGRGPLGPNEHISLVDRTHTVPRITPPKTHSAPAAARPGRRHYLSARARARVNSSHSLVAARSLALAASLARLGVPTHRS
jgi:hypothetical protein